MLKEIPLPSDWLQQVGFKLGNPFSTREAAAEPESALVRYFVSHPSFEDILGSASHPRSSFLVAKRGCGKTTSRRVIEWHCRAGRLDAPILAVPYTEFTVSLRHADANGRVPAKQHIEAILRQALVLLMDALAEQPEKTEAFIGGLREELVSYLGYFSDLLTNRGLDKWLHQKGLLNRTINTHSLRSHPGDNDQTFLRFLGMLLAIQPGAWNLQNLVPSELMTGFVDLARLAGFQTVYILIDRVDEREPMASDPTQAANLLARLVTNLPLMELANTAFKLFITPEVMQALQKNSALRPERLLTRDISWHPQQLQDLLDRRVEVFTEGMLPSLDAVSQSGNLVSQMAEKAQGSPRNMLRLAEWLLYRHYERSSQITELILIQKDLDEAFRSFDTELNQPIILEENKLLTVLRESKQEIEPTSNRLWIDESAQIWRGETPLKRFKSKNHYKLFLFLLEREGQVCNYDDISYAVYGEKEVLSTRGVRDERIDKLVQRIRRHVEEDPSRPKFIVKVPGQGYVLDQS